MHYTILVFTCSYIYFGTPCAILRGVVKSSQLKIENCELSTTPLRMEQGVLKHM
jgi:hypothetical protein